MIACSAVVFFFKQKTAYEWRISDWSSDVCSSDLVAGAAHQRHLARRRGGLGARGTLGSLHVHGFLSSRTTIAGHPRFLAGLGKRDRKSVVKGKSVSVRVDLGGSRHMKKKQDTSVSINIGIVRQNYIK